MNWYAYVGNDPLNFVDPTGTVMLDGVTVTPSTCPSGSRCDSFPAMIDRFAVKADKTLWEFRGNPFNTAILDFENDVSDWGAGAAEELGGCLFDAGCATTMLGPLGQLANLSKVASAENAVFKLTKTVAGHADTRPFVNSNILIRQIMRAGKGSADPRGVRGALRWDIPGQLGKTKGTWQLVVDPTKRLVLHFNFVKR